MSGFRQRVEPQAANYTYSVTHFGVTGGVLIWLFLRRPSVYRAARSILLFTTVLGLLGYWLMPLGPPRFFPALGFVDTVVRDDTWAALAYPALIFLVIVGTGNHWVLDIAAGMAALALAATAYVVSRSRKREARCNNSTTASSLVCGKFT